MKLLTINTVCTATVFETWYVAVPNDWDGDPLEALEEYDATCVSEDVTNETDREVRSVELRP